MENRAHVKVIETISCCHIEYQFVTTNRPPDRLGRVKKGAGMGMKNSGELSCASFAKLVETWCLLPEVPTAFCIDLYGRLKDDMIVVARDRKLTKHYVWSMKQRSKYYNIKWSKFQKLQ